MDYQTVYLKFMFLWCVAHADGFYAERKCVERRGVWEGRASVLDLYSFRNCMFYVVLLYIGVVVVVVGRRRGAK